MEDDLNFFKMEDDLKLFKMEDDLKFVKMEDDLKFSNGRQPKTIKCNLKQLKLKQWLWHRSG